MKALEKIPAKTVQGVLILCYPLCLHLGVQLQAPWLQIVALALLVLGLCWSTVITGSALARCILVATLAGVALCGLLDWQRYLRLLPPTLFSAFFGIYFLRSTAGGANGAIADILSKLRSQPTPAMFAYCRKLALVWGWFLLAMCAWSTLASIMLLLGEIRETVWSNITSVFNYLALAALFAGEYVFRRWLFRDAEHRSFFDSIRAIRNMESRSGR